MYLESRNNLKATTLRSHTKLATVVAITTCHIVSGNPSASTQLTLARDVINTIVASVPVRCY